jgi:putative intracellular protease/amidase
MTQIAIVVYPGYTALDFIGPYEVLRQVHATSTWTTSVCSGSIILAAAGVLTGRRATSHWLVLPMLKPFGVEPDGNQPIVHLDKVVTAAGVSAGIELPTHRPSHSWPIRPTFQPTHTRQKI